MAEDHLRDLVALNMTLRVGVAEYEQLVAGLGSHAALAGASAAELHRRAGLGHWLAGEIPRLLHGEDPDEEIRQAAERGITLVAFNHPAYPAQLRVIANPPLVLYVQGTLEPADAVAVAVVGTRRPTPYGAAQAAALTASLAVRGLTIVSGLARGVDTAAHRAALQAGGRTIAVLGGGLARLYPPENAALADDIVEGGAIVTEFPLHTRPWRAFFPRRNRIISGLSLGVLVIEAAERSGALITADWALDQNREVFAIPGRIDRRSAGCHALLKQGARLVETDEDVIRGLGRVGETLAPPPPRREATPPALGPDELTILRAVGDDPTHADTITEATGLPAPTVVSVLMVLELKKAVQQLPGKHFVRTADLPDLA